MDICNWESLQIKWREREGGEGEKWRGGEGERGEGGREEGKE